MDRAKFYAALRKRGSGVFGTSLSRGQVEGIEADLNEAEKRRTPLKWLSYMLATASSKYLHLFRKEIAEINDLDTLNCFAICKCFTPLRARRRISSTSASLSFDVGADSPCLCRLRSTMSLVFSAFVPSNKWAGLTHGGLSHVCRTIIPSGTRFSLAISQETTCVYASPSARDPRPIWPCPNGCRHPRHSQHSASPFIDVFAHSRDSSGIILRGICKILHIHETVSFNYRCVNV